MPSTSRSNGTGTPSAAGSLLVLYSVFEAQRSGNTIPLYNVIPLIGRAEISISRELVVGEKFFEQKPRQRRTYRTNKFSLKLIDFGNFVLLASRGCRSVLIVTMIVLHGYE